MSKIIIFFILNSILCRKYPIFDEIEKSKKGKIKTIDVASPESYLDYVKNNDNVVSYFHSDFCDVPNPQSPILDNM